MICKMELAEAAGIREPPKMARTEPDGATRAHVPKEAERDAAMSGEERLFS